MNHFLFDEFDKITPTAWKQKIQVDLKGADYNESLLWKTDDGITVKPFYTKEDRKNHCVKLPKKGFNICQSIFIDDEKIANFLAIDSIKRGANAIFFTTKKKFDYKIVLKGINVSSIILYFKFQFLSADFVIELSNTINSKNCYFNIDIIGNLAETGNWFINLKEDYHQLEKITKNTLNPIEVDASLYQNAGANNIQQLAYALAHANEYLYYFGKEIASKIHFTFSVGSNYFFEIAKLRTFRILWHTLLAEYNVKKTETHLFVQPSLRNKTIYDYNVNMLRTTSECMSAILGGANTIANISYDAVYHKSNEFGERIARNQLLVLQQESYLKEAQYVAEGSYYIDSITHQLAEKSLNIFKHIEKGGGFLKQLKEGVIQRKIVQSAKNESDKFENKTITLLGVNKLEDFNNKMKNDIEIYCFSKKKTNKTLIFPIIKKRLAESIEKKRLEKEYE